MQSPDGSHDAVVPLSRVIARELVLLSVLSPWVCTNVAVEYLSTAYASDASLEKGAFVSAEIGCKRAASLWLDSDKKGVELYLTLAPVRC